MMPRSVCAMLSGSGARQNTQGQEEYPCRNSSSSQGRPATPAVGRRLPGESSPPAGRRASPGGILPLHRCDARRDRALADSALQGGVHAGTRQVAPHPSGRQSVGLLLRRLRVPRDGAPRRHRPAARPRHPGRADPRRRSGTFRDQQARRPVRGLGRGRAEILAEFFAEGLAHDATGQRYGEHHLADFLAEIVAGGRRQPTSLHSAVELELEDQPAFGSAGPIPGHRPGAGGSAIRGTSHIPDLETGMPRIDRHIPRDSSRLTLSQNSFWFYETFS